jgi:hypothetical protein
VLFECIESSITFLFVDDFIIIIDFNELVKVSKRGSELKDIQYAR